ncbi:fimbrial protein [Yersinia intermedia]|uniref:Fimbrial protein n=1 Tax=Yersinia intermedia TaxID=631 RepID=A0ABX6F329_YERIN|nr:fimbrial protein [Yersinia intermedia]QGR68431.1 hypothetical protein FOC38_22385 [Yersinia intermedia]QGR69433.1 hypothetical protein FOC37_03040 [Yersinia intermedia]
MMKNVICSCNTIACRLSKISILSLLAIVGVILSVNVYAACPAKGTSTGTVTFGTQTVTSTAVGGLIATKTVSIGSGNILNIVGTLYYNLTRFTSLSSLGNGIYDTNIPGIGIRVYVANTSSANMFPKEEVRNGTGYTQPAPYIVELYKTAASVQSGIITTGQIATLSCGSPSTNIYNAINLSAVTIVDSACTVNSSDITVPIGNVNSSIFTTVGSTSNATAFTIPLTCPSSGVQVKMQLDGNTVNGSTTALSLNNSGTDGAASGYGVQIITGSSPIVIGTPTAVATTTSGQVSIPLKARYIKTSAISNGGVANSTATFTMTYE